MTTIEKIRSAIINEYNNNAESMDWSYRAGLAKALDIIKEYAEQEPCDDAISREVIKKEYKRRIEDSLKDNIRGIDYSELVDCSRFNAFVDSVPSVRPQEQTGHWIYPYETTTLVSICSECGTHGSGNFCPDCGARMEERTEE